MIELDNSAEDIWEKILAHQGHDLTCAEYGDACRVIECLDCNEIIINVEAKDV